MSNILLACIAAMCLLLSGPVTDGGYTDYPQPLNFWPDRYSPIKPSWGYSGFGDIAPFTPKGTVVQITFEGSKAQVVTQRTNITYCELWVYATSPQADHGWGHVRTPIPVDADPEIRECVDFQGEGGHFGDAPLVSDETAPTGHIVYHVVKSVIPATPGREPMWDIYISWKRRNGL